MTRGRTFIADAHNSPADDARRGNRAAFERMVAENRRRAAVRTTMARAVLGIVVLTVVSLLCGLIGAGL